MKRYVKNSTAYFDGIEIDSIISIVLVGDIDSYNPRDFAIYAATKLDYSTLTREQLLQLDKKTLESIHDVRILRKLNRNELTPQQQYEVSQANKENFNSSIKDVKNVLAKLKECPSFHVWQTVKNNAFAKQIWDLGGRMRDDDAYNIIHDLHVSDYCHSTLSYVDSNWNSLLMVFEYNHPYTFSSRERDGEPVTVDKLDVYIKIDVNNEEKEGYAAMSFHAPEHALSHPYKDYPVEKE